MKQFKFALIMAACTIAVFYGCKKTDDRTLSTPTETPIIADKQAGIAAFGALRSLPQTFTVAAGVSKNIKCAQGTILKFYPNSFKDASGNIITSGNVTISVTEIYTLGDMIANRTATVTSSGVLTSRGEVNIKASMNGQEVFANKYGLGFKAINAETQPMELYEGIGNNSDSIITWDLKRMATTGGTQFITDTNLALLESPYFLFDSCTKFTLINCDHPHDGTSEQVKINVVFPDNIFSQAYASLGITFKELNVMTIMGTRQYLTGTKTMTFEGWSPIGNTSKFSLIIPKSTDEYYYFESAGQVANGMTINASSIQKLSKVQLQAKLAAL